MYIQSVLKWSNISNKDPSPRNIKPKFNSEELFICWNLFLDFIAIYSGINIACKWAKYNIVENNLNKEISLIL